MNTEVILAVIALALVYLAVRIATTTRNRNREAKASAAIKKGALVIDVRSTVEFSAGAYPGSINIPVDDLPKRLGELGTDTSRPLLVYCASGMRSRRAAKMLSDAGFTDIYDAGSVSGLPLPPVH